MSAVYLQGNSNSKYPKLNPSSDDLLELWVYLCANFGYADSSSLVLTAKNLMAYFYRIHFPNSKHKISEGDIKIVESMLNDSYSDVMCPVYLSMVEKENQSPSFKHPDDWNELSDMEKAHQLVKTLFLKLLAVIDFSDMSFKEVTSLYDPIETFLNQDSRLERNKLKPPRFVEEVKIEIWKTLTTINFYQNKESDAFP